MDNLATLLVVFLVVTLAAFVIYRVAIGSGSSSSGPTAPGRPRTDFDTDPR